ncbi:MAG: hypothetical protein QOI83_2731 [Streptomycetaceae bacterium]|jgi:hypothetical protein|nr:hypothetical protein [Streptomycetaceae bacterium]
MAALSAPRAVARGHDVCRGSIGSHQPQEPAVASAPSAAERGRGTATCCSSRASIWTRPLRSRWRANIGVGVPAVPVLHDPEPAVDLSAQAGAGEIGTGEDRAHSTPTRQQHGALDHHHIGIPRAPARRAR